MRMSASAKRSITITLDGTNKSISLPLIDGTSDRPSPISASCTAIWVSSPTIPATAPPPRAKARSPTSTATRASCSIAAIRSSSWPRSRLPRGLLPADERRAAERRAARGVRARRHAAHDDARAAPHFFSGFRRDAHPMAMMCGVVGSLSAFYHDSLDIHDPESRRSARSA